MLSRPQLDLHLWDNFRARSIHNINPECQGVYICSGIVHSACWNTIHLHWNLPCTFPITLTPYLTKSIALFSASTVRDPLNLECLLFTPNTDKLRTLLSLATSLDISFKMFPLLALEASTGACAIKRGKHLVRWWYLSPWFMNKSSWLTVYKHYPLFLATRIKGF